MEPATNYTITLCGNCINNVLNKLFYQDETLNNNDKEYSISSSNAIRIATLLGCEHFTSVGDLFLRKANCRVICANEKLEGVPELIDRIAAIMDENISDLQVVLCCNDPIQGSAFADKVGIKFINQDELSKELLKEVCYIETIFEFSLKRLKNDDKETQSSLRKKMKSLVKSKKKLKKINNADDFNLYEKSLISIVNKRGDRKLVQNLMHAYHLSNENDLITLLLSSKRYKSIYNIHNAPYVWWVINGFEDLVTDVKRLIMDKYLK